MEAVFLKILNMSITASYLVFAVMLARLLLKKTPKFITVILWGLVAVRLICPFSFESILSLIPSSQTVPSDIMYTDTPQIYSGISSVNTVVNDIVMPQFYPDHIYSANPLQIWGFVASVVWVVGVTIMLLYTLISYIHICFKVCEAVKLEGNIFECDRINTPFILGVIKPKIYLPSNMSGCDREYVIAHERAHLKRCDHLWKPLGFLLLSIYWFNPVIWVAYILLCRDIELACDENVIKQLGEQNKKPYSEALINCSVPRKMIAACPVAFGETGVKARIKAVLSYKKPTFWMIIIAVVLSIAVSVCFMTNPATKISEFKDEEIDYGTVFNKAEKILAGVGDVEYTISYEEDIKEIKNQFQKIRIDKVPISYNESIIYDTTNWIMIGKYWLWFSEDFSQFGGTLSIRSYMPPPYKVLNPRAAEKLFDLISTSESRRINNKLNVSNIKAGTTLDGVVITVKQISLDVGDPYIELELKNNSDSNYEFGVKMDLYYMRGDKKESCSTFKHSESRKRAVPAVARLLFPDGTAIQKYTFTHDDISKAGTYRLETQVAWVEFELKK